MAFHVDSEVGVLKQVIVPALGAFGLTTGPCDAPGGLPAFGVPADRVVEGLEVFDSLATRYGSHRCEGSSTFTNVISGCFVFVNGDDAGDGRPDMNYHPRFKLLQSSLAVEVKTEVQIVLDMASVG